jgi:AcrR family transcriptional regulator
VAVPPRVKADEKRREVVERAATLFDSAGYHTTSVAELAAAVGLSKPALYHYVSSKDEILFWIHEEFIDLLIAKQKRRPSDVPASAALREIMSDLLELMDTHRGHVRVFF